MFSEWADLYQNKLLSSFDEKYHNYIYFSDAGPKNSRFFSVPGSNKEHIWYKPTLNRKLSYEMFSKKADLY